MTKLTIQGEKDSANTDLPQFHDPDDQVIGLDTDDTVPPDETDIQNDPETETIEIDPEEAAVLAYFANARRDQLEALPEPTKRDLQREEQIWAEPEDNLTSWTTQCGCTSAKSDAFHSSTPGRSNTWHAVSRRWHTCTRSPD